MRPSNIIMKIKDNFVLILMFCFLISCNENSGLAKKQEEPYRNGWDEEPLYGDIDSIIIKAYKLTDKFGKLEKKLVETQKCIFNEYGDVIEFMYFDDSNKEIESLFVFKYDDNRNEIEWSKYNANGDLEYRRFDKYDTYGKYIESSLYYGDGDLDTKTFIRYYDNSSKSESYNQEGILESSTTMFYDSAGNLIEEIYESIDTYSLIMPSGKFTYKYDNNGNKIETICYNHAGELDFKSICTYNEKDKIVKYIKYDKTNKIDYTTVYSYNDYGDISESVTYNGNGTLKNKEVYLYDDKGKKIEHTNYNDKGNITYKKIYKYDDQGNIIECMHYNNAIMTPYYSKEYMIYYS